ncbi:hypothetical protein DMA11_07455 [Marinilabiliaceae bacterium JC017]|nr:hypothetical protein DMA11_07455 [Marinilabiliaceae bacterium JC017]
MKTIKLLLLLALFILIGFFVGKDIMNHKGMMGDGSVRYAVITFDDLPVVFPTTLDSAAAITNKLLAVLEKYEVPAVGFVNQGKVDQMDDPKGYADLLKRWVEKGCELGNHTYSHCHMDRVSLDSLKTEVIMGERLIKNIMQQKGRPLRYFRHPYLQTGADSVKKAGFEKFLEERGYLPAPVTAGYFDWLFNAAYRNAGTDSLLKQQVADSYLQYMEKDMAYNEEFSKEVLGYEVKQILMFHVNRLNADHLEEVLIQMQKRGYQFISLEEAMTDEAYERGNPYVGDMSVAWLQRWALADSIPLKPVPKVDPFIEELSGIKVNSRELVQ